MTAHAGNAFTLTDMSGTKHRLADYQGKWVVVNYWATWCPPCLEEVPDLVNLYDQRRDKDLMVLGVVFDFNNVKEVEKFADDMLMSYPIVLGSERTVEEIGSAAILPTTYIYNPQGQLVKIKKGLITKQYIEALLDGSSR
ncbi:MAG: TlpA disulfide reductase family protein [Nitrosomonadales bacterium]|nr:TlpA disulfide reductase family protein [Nitrosomonadales bacterium]